MRRTRLALVGCVFLLATVEARAKTWIVAGVMNGPGANDTFFSTEIILVNPDGDSRFVTLIPIGPPGSPIFDPLRLTLAPGETRSMTSPLVGAGALRISADGGVVVFAQIDSTPAAFATPPPPPAGGSSLPVIDEEALLQAGETGHAGWVAQSKDPSVGSRTNVGLVFPGSEGGAAAVTLFDAQGSILGTVVDDVPSSSAVANRLDAFTSLDVPMGRISVTVTRGTAYGYVAVAETSTFGLAVAGADRLPPAPPPSAFGRVDLVSSGVAQIAGRDGSFWHTDARLANPGTSRVTVTAYLIGAGPAAAPASIPLEAGQTLEVDDIVQSLFNLSGPTAGAVLWRGDGPFLVSTRTRNGDVAESTGFSVHAAVPLDGFLTSADPAGQLAGLRQGAASRTNIRATGGPGGATFDLELFDETGQPMGTVHRVLPPLGWTQFALSDPMPGVVAPDRRRFQVRVVSGSVSVQAAILDSGENAPVFFEASPPGVRVAPPVPPVPAGAWGGAPNGMDHLIVDDTSISIFRPCQNGSFPQPLRLDADGGFGVLGAYIVSLGPAFQLDAILSGHTDGQVATVQVTPISPLLDLVDTNSESFTLGAPFEPFTGICPIEYRTGR